MRWSICRCWSIWNAPRWADRELHQTGRCDGPGPADTRKGGGAATCPRALSTQPASHPGVARRPWQPAAATTPAQPWSPFARGLMAGDAGGMAAVTVKKGTCVIECWACYWGERCVWAGRVGSEKYITGVGVPVGTHFSPASLQQHNHSTSIMKMVSINSLLIYLFI